MIEGSSSAAAALAGVLLVLVAGACSGGGESPEACDRLIERMEKCGGDLPRTTLWNAKMYCRLSMQYELEPGQSPDNMAAVTKATLTECAGPAGATCDGLRDCYARHECSFLMTSPGATPQFQCWK